MVLMGFLWICEGAEWVGLETGGPSAFCGLCSVLHFLVWVHGMVGWDGVVRFCMMIPQLWLT